MAEPVIDTTFAVPGPGGGGAALTISLVLALAHQQLPDMRALLYPEHLTAIGQAVEYSKQSYEHTRAQVRAGIEHARDGEFDVAAPLLAAGVEGLYRATADARGLLDDHGRLKPLSGTGRARKAGGPELVAALPINERVQRMLKRHAFGDAANVYRHGGADPVVGWKEQCELWLLAIVAWLDGFGWG